MMFKHPLVLAAIPLMAIWYMWLRIKRSEPAFIFPTDDVIRLLRGSPRTWAAGKVAYLRLAALILILIALARPQANDELMKRRDGIAVMLSIDCSSTMLAEDLQLGPSGLVAFFEDPAAKKVKRLNRIDAVKEVAREFVRAGPNNMNGVVAFAAYAYVICPLTFDQEWVLSSIDRIKVGIIKDATAIGSGILAGVNSLSTVKAKSKVIILLTDGNNNYGKIPPIVAAKTAKSLGVKIYTIGIVSEGQTLYPTKDEQGRKAYEYVSIALDGAMLRKIAELTGGTYYRVTSLKSLKESYADIDKLEKTLLEQREMEDAEDVFPAFLYWALFALLADIALSNTYLRRIP